MTQCPLFALCATFARRTTCRTTFSPGRVASQSIVLRPSISESISEVSRLSPASEDGILGDDSPAGSMPSKALLEDCIFGRGEASPLFRLTLFEVGLGPFRKAPRGNVRLCIRIHCEERAGRKVMPSRLSDRRDSR
ncbi:hypothetical protein BCV69DRAFT_188318 [Microstroma glucosiphilum]|uniref:Uncharacterized protein n=1 Tax=Pseudomicrostroma glucosiphilum TaxID=1684307 RepID=A0A316U7C6_9BASI|nr:hypothetical protein BCV69DRAFT_188318 [Pseudomicrostroma glucosiphilum]PWN21140.1 hypothetical protein BCV69DRAFT_188318 [Pseudomicrostroma glucosiphilum]